MLTAIGIITLIILLALSAFFAGSETGVYRLSRFTLRIDVEKNKPLASTLTKIIDDTQALIFSLLIGNNLVNYLATTLATILLLNSSLKHNAEFFTTVIMTPALFIFSEVIPKNIYYYRANTLMLQFAPLLWFFHKLFKYTGLVLFLKSFSKMISSLLPTPAGFSDAISASRTHVAGIIDDTRQEGILTNTQTEIFTRLMDIPSITLNSVMTPIADVQMLNVESNRDTVLNKLKKYPFTRLPVYENKRSNIIGYINIYRVLSTNDNFENLRDFIKPFNSFPPGMKIISAISAMQQKKDKIRLIDTSHVHKHSAYHQPVGIVTMKDLVEELTGELEQW
jgi:putative hemolysin